jgi:hypothetical protein
MEMSAETLMACAEFLERPPPADSPGGMGYRPLWGRWDGRALEVWLDKDHDLMVDASGDLPTLTVVKRREAKP